MGTGKSTIKVPTDPVSGEDLLPGLQIAISQCILRWQRDKVGNRQGKQGRGRKSLLFTSLLLRALIPSWGHQSYDLITFQRPPLLTPSCWEVKISTREYSGDTEHSVYNSSQSDLEEENRGKCLGEASPVTNEIQWFGLCTCLELSRKMQQDWMSAPALKEERIKAKAQDSQEPSRKDSWLFLGSLGLIF